MSEPQATDILVKNKPFHALTPARKVDALISAENAAEQVAAVEPFALYHLVTAVGVEDCVELVKLATPEQIQCFVDLEGWQGNHLATRRVGEWLSFFLREDNERLERIVEDLDPEVVPLYLKDHISVYLMEEEDEAPAELVVRDVHYELTPDRMYALVYETEDETEGRRVRLLIERLYGIDPMKAWRFLEATRCELKAEMEENALRFRAGRLSDLGFSPAEEAMKIFRPIDPIAFKRTLTLNGEASGHVSSRHDWLIPSAAQDEFDKPSFLSKTLDALHTQQPEVVDGIKEQIVYLVNRVMSAERAEPSNRSALRRVLEMVHGNLSMALEFLADRDVNGAAEVVRSVHTQSLFRVGQGLCITLQGQAKQLIQNAPAELRLVDGPPMTLLGSDDRLVLRSVLRRRPQYGDPQTQMSVPFASLEQIERTATRLALIGFKVMAVFGLVGAEKHDLVIELTQENTSPPVELCSLDTILGTTVARLLLGEPASTAALTREDLAKLADALGQLTDERGATKAVAERLLGALAGGAALPMEARPVATAVLSNALVALREEYGGLSAESVRNGGVSVEELGAGLIARFA